ncbi:uncharacterized protein CCOS01_02549 [Colletotrichum costaricense]|uniref:Uncharacterized protein n=1 Tax=Colletotrichum costaricense TaxID=1209916 RepID=A0AAI9Z881_9PEZI|nr:uncharacterized protein CCOS01_02549 [Colletotrichum costaricense]KAK1537229.1 hypothetical protein CCOS01_02549 [Colletotrichum costaricense]
MEKDLWHRAGGAWGPPKFVGNSGELLAVREHFSFPYLQSMDKRVQRSASEQITLVVCDAITNVERARLYFCPICRSKGVQCHTTNETKASEQVKQKPKESSREIVRGKQLALSAGVLTV